MKYTFQSMLFLLKQDYSFAIVDNEKLKNIQTPDGHNLAYALIQLEMSLNDANRNTYSKALTIEKSDIVNFFLNNKDLFAELPTSTIRPIINIKEEIFELHEMSAKPAIHYVPFCIEKLCQELASPAIKKEEKNKIEFKLAFYEELEFNYVDSLGIPSIVQAVKAPFSYYLNWILNKDKNLLTEDHEKNATIIDVIKKEKSKFNTNFLGAKNNSVLFDKLIAKLEKENLECMMENSTDETQKTKAKLKM